MRRPLMAANWKMHKTSSEAIAFMKELLPKVRSGTVEVVICPPFPDILAISEITKDSVVKLGAQNMYWEDKGAFTGEVSCGMLKESGCEYVIIGHSERRKYFHETDETVNRKVKKAISSRLIPIMCIGETLQEREKGVTFKVVETQLRGGLQGLSLKTDSQLVIAYEPVWAIGTGKTATPEQAEEVHAFIRKLLYNIYNKGIADGLRILYGGSIKPANITQLMACENIDGGLVGGASLEVSSFLSIINY